MRHGCGNSSRTFAMILKGKGAWPIGALSEAGNERAICSAWHDLDLRAGDMAADKILSCYQATCGSSKWVGFEPGSLPDAIERGEGSFKQI